MNRQLAKKRLLELEEQAAELKRRKRNRSSDSITHEGFVQCYHWMQINKCFQAAPEDYENAVAACNSTPPNPHISFVTTFFSKFDSKF